MRKFSKHFITFLLFVDGTYGERIFKYAYTLLQRFPQTAFVTYGVIVSAIFLIALSNKK